MAGAPAPVAGSATGGGVTSGAGVGDEAGVACWARMGCGAAINRASNTASATAQPVGGLLPGPCVRLGGALGAFNAILPSRVGCLTPGQRQPETRLCIGVPPHQRRSVDEGSVPPIRPGQRIAGAPRSYVHSVPSPRILAAWRQEIQRSGPPVRSPSPRQANSRGDRTRQGPLRRVLRLPRKRLRGSYRFLMGPPSMALCRPPIHERTRPAWPMLKPRPNLLTSS